jgi:putative oxidoreductase
VNLPGSQAAAAPRDARRAAGQAFALLVRLGLSGLFAYAAIGKLGDPGGFAQDVSNYRVVPDALAPLLALGVPVLELVTAIALLLPGYARGGAALSALMLAGFALGMAQAKLRGIDLECGCFGTDSGAKVSWGKVALNGGLAILSLWIIRFDPRAAKTASSPPPPHAAAGERSP